MSIFNTYRKHHLATDMATIETSVSQLYGMLNLRPSDIAINDILEDALIITVIGEFNAGKSTLLNALLALDILPTGIVPTTATINVVKYNPTPLVSVTYMDGQEEQISFKKEALERFKATKGTFEDVRTISIMSPDAPKGCQFIDTPGVNDICQTRMDIVYGFIPNSEAIIFVMDIQQALKKSEIDFLKERLLGVSLTKIIYVLNHIDRTTSQETNEIMREVEEKLKNIYADVASDFEDKGCIILSKLILEAKKNLRIYPVSVKNVAKNHSQSTDPFFVKLSESLNELASQTHNIKIQRRLSKIELSLQEINLQLLTVEKIEKESGEIIISHIEKYTDEIRLIVNRMRTLGTEFDLNVNKLKNDENERLNSQMQNIKMDYLRNIDTADPSNIEVKVKKMIEAELVNIRDYLSSISDEYSKTLRLDCNFSLGGLFNVNDNNSQHDQPDLVKPLIYASIEAIGYIFFGPLGLLAGPVFAIIESKNKFGKDKILINKCFDDVTNKLVNEISEVIDKATIQIKSFAIESLDKSLIPLRSLLINRVNGVPPFDIKSARSIYNNLIKQIETISLDN